MFKSPNFYIYYRIFKFSLLKRGCLAPDIINFASSVLLFHACHDSRLKALEDGIDPSQGKDPWIDRKGRSPSLVTCPKNEASVELPLSHVGLLLLSLFTIGMSSVFLQPRLS
jgi:hypothetical protein